MVHLLHHTRASAAPHSCICCTTVVHLLHHARASAAPRSCICCATLVHPLHHAPASAAPPPPRLTSRKNNLLINSHWSVGLSSLFLSILSFWSLHSVSVTIWLPITAAFFAVVLQIQKSYLYSPPWFSWDLNIWAYGPIIHWFSTAPSSACRLNCSQYW